MWSHVGPLVFAVSPIPCLLKLQLEERKKDDWISTCITDLKSLGISGSLEQIMKKPRIQFRKKIIENIREQAGAELCQAQHNLG